MLDLTSRLVRRLAMLLAISAFMAPRQAQAFVPLQPAPVSVCSLAPSLAADGTGTCANPAYLNDCHHVADCAPLLQSRAHAQFQAAAAAGRSADVVLPAAMADGAGANLGHAYSGGVRLQPSALTPVTGTLGTGLATAFDHTALSNALSATQQPNDNQLFSAVTGSLYSPRALWRAPPGGADPIGSCSEYVYKKWQAYSAFDEAARIAGDHYDWITKIAAGQVPSGTPGTPLQSLLTMPVRSDGTRIDDVRSTSIVYCSDPISAFQADPNHACNMSTPGTFWTAQINRGDNTGLPYLYRGAAWPRNIFFTFVPGWLNTSNPLESQIASALQSKISTPIPVDGDNTIAWAAAMYAGPSAPLGKIKLTTFHDYERRMNHFADLIVQLVDLQAHIDLLSDRCYVNPAGCVPPGEGIVGSPTPMPDTSPVPSFERFFFATDAARRAAAIQYASTTMPEVANTIAALRAHAPPCVLEGTPPACTPSVSRIPWQSYSYRRFTLATATTALARAADDLVQALKDEWGAEGRGCLGYVIHDPATGSDVPVTANGCDLSPISLAQRYSGLFQNERQQAYQQCLADTGDDFSILRDNSAIFSDPRVPGTFTRYTPVTWQPIETHVGLRRAYDQSLDDVQTFLLFYENRDALNQAYASGVEKQKAALRAQLADLPAMSRIPDTQGGPSPVSGVFGETLHDGNDIGGDWFGGGYEYSASWTVSPIDSSTGDPTYHYYPVCSFSGSARGYVRAHATILKQYVSILDASLDLTMGPGHETLDSKFMFFGNDLCGRACSTTPTDFAGVFDVPIASSPAGPDFATIVPILFIPVKVSASLTVQAGAELKATSIPPPQCDPLNPGFTLAAQVNPFVRVDANAEAAIDAVIASVGVSGQLNIVTVNLPVGASINVGPDQTNHLRLGVDLNADLQMSELSGNVDLFAEVGVCPFCDRGNLPLFSWAGFHQAVPLFHHTKSYDIDAVNFAANGQYNPNHL